MRESNRPQPFGGGAATATVDEPSAESRVTSGDARSVHCLYCSAPIPAASFVYWTRASRLLSADCPTCTRRTTLAVRGLGPLPKPAERGITIVAPRSTLELVQVALCACGHDPARHDEAAQRYCAQLERTATQSRCICPPAGAGARFL